MGSACTLACFPGSFSPPTLAHLAIAEAARSTPGIDGVELVVSAVALTKEHLTVPSLHDRVEVLHRVARRRPWLSVAVTHAQLIADIAAGYGAVVLGADKWHQIQDPVFYPDETTRDRAVASLPRPLLIPRAGHDLVVPDGVEVLDLPHQHRSVSSTRARDGEVDLMLPEAKEFDERTGAWSDPERYVALGRG